MGHGHKRKRHSLQDTPVDLSKMRMALICLDALKEELEGIQETEEELDYVMTHFLALEEILKTAKKPRLSFSMVKDSDLKKAGVVRDLLSFNAATITRAAQDLTSRADSDIKDLSGRIKKINARVNMDYEAGSRMILDAIVLSLTDIALVNRRNVVILPEMRIPFLDEAQLVNSDSGFEIWLNGHVDYAVLEYDDSAEKKARLLGPGAFRDALKLSQGRLFLVKAERGMFAEGLLQHIPEAVSQAIALLKSSNDPKGEVRFCLSTGESWIFFVLKSEGGKLIYYESVIRTLNMRALQRSDEELREILLLVCEWLHPTIPNLFTLGTKKPDSK